MSDKNEPAFPTHDASDHHDSRERILTGGITQRDYFAGQALAGFTSCGLDDGDPVMGAADTARACYNYADAMMTERERGQ